MKALDLTGVRFGKLRVLHLASGRVRSWLCVCDCGKPSVVPTGRLRSGNTRSCGCEKRAVLGRSTVKHGQAGTRTYRIWKAMRGRCNNPNATGYKNYGGRGVRVCARWNRFDTFLADMGEAPPDASLERRNNDGNYAPENCYWATRAQQTRNTRRNVRGQYAGRVWCMADLADAHGIPRETARKRYARGWSFAAACTVPPRGARRGSLGTVGNPNFVPLRGKLVNIKEVP